MKIYVQLCLAELLEWDVSDKSCKKKRKRVYMFNIFFWKSCCLWGNVQKYGGTRQATYANIIRRKKNVICLPDN